MNPETFKTKLLEWWQVNKRTLPWKNQNDPYKIWISEIILQQTRVQQGIPYYEKFIHMFPDIYALATATEDSVLKAWQGLGYYSRARNLHFTAKCIVSKHHGAFPDTYTEILSLKGIGPYTAAAIASFAFGLKHAVMDGNVIRVVARICGITDPSESATVRKSISGFVNIAISNAHADEFNQAIMDFGATMCLPQNPDCVHCPLSDHCIAFTSSTVKLIPFKSKKIIRKKRYFHYLVCTTEDGQIIIQQRIEQDIWQLLHQFPLIETDSDEILSDIMIMQKLGSLAEVQISEISYTIQKISVFKQILTHQKITGIFYQLTMNSKGFKIKKEHYLVERKKVSNFAFPKIITDFISTHSLF